ncbi:MAG: alkaline phosphatase [Acidobacteria bacterium]|nr:alkaline phosphatase [Acidobacteriota bacterium]
MQARRDIIRSGALGLLLAPFGRRLLAAPSFTANPFALGVASGDPAPDGAVLWTRLIPDPAREAAWQRERVSVRYRVSTDEAMKRIVRQGSATAAPELGHSVHVELRGLEPGRHYWYQFDAAGSESPVGRTRTAPVSSDRLRFAFASCQHWESGYYTAYRHMAEEDLDLVVHLGDYVYEGPTRAGGVRQHPPHEMKTLTQYRERYALYRSDALLRQAHERFPWIVTWDDHEVDNNYAADVPEDSQTRQDFLERRANAYQAFYEFMPLRKGAMPRGSGLKLYRQVPYGALASFHVLDTRQYRGDQPCGDGDKPPCEAWHDPNLSMLGQAQEKWLEQGLAASRATWNVLANQVMLARIDRDAGPGELHPMDQWSGYDAARRRMMDLFAGRPVNPIVVTGDVHSSWVSELRSDYKDSGKPAVAVEFTGTSISSGGDGVPVPERVAQYLPDNPHVKFYNSQRGYVSCDVTPKAFTASYRILDKVTQRDMPIARTVSYTVAAGRAAAEKV